MSVLALPPGTRLGGRYRLERALRRGDAWVVWQGTDEALARSVALRVVPAADVAAARLIAAARAAGRVASPRLASVLDAMEVDGVVVVVSEWLPGTPLRDLLAAGPLPPVEAARILAGAAAALAEAHRAGLTHGAVTADSVVLAATGPRLAGCGLDAALAGIQPDPAADVRALGSLLFAALTGRAPSGVPHEPAVPVPALAADPVSGLPPAPVVAGRGCTARQVRGGVPAVLDGLAERALGRLPPFPTAAELAAALGAAADEAELRPARPMRRRLVPLAILAVLIGAGWLAGRAVGRLPSRPVLPTLPSVAAASPAPTGTRAAVPAAYPPAEVRDFDPYGDGTESPDAVRLAYDGDPATAWSTSIYRSRPDFGGLKPGVGLLVDLGAERTVRTVDVVVSGGPTDIELRSGARASDRADAYDVVASAPGATGRVTMRPSRPTARYWLLWITRLPPADGGYRASVADIAFRP